VGEGEGKRQKAREKLRKCLKVRGVHIAMSANMFASLLVSNPLFPSTSKSVEKLFTLFERFRTIMGDGLAGTYRGFE